MLDGFTTPEGRDARAFVINGGSVRMRTIAEGSIPSRGRWVPQPGGFEGVPRFESKASLVRDHMLRVAPWMECWLVPELHDGTYGHSGGEIVVAVAFHEHHIVGTLAHELMHVVEHLLAPPT